MLFRSQWVPASPLQGYLALGCILVFLLFMQMLIAPVYWLLMSELFPAHVRGLVTGLAVAMQWVFNGIVAFVFPMMLDAWGAQTFWVAAAINVVSLVFVRCCVPETRGHSLEQIERLMRTAHARKKSSNSDSLDHHQVPGNGLPVQ